MKRILLLLLSGIISISQAQKLTIQELGRYTDGRDAACEISTYHAASKQVFTTNAASGKIDRIDLSNPNQPELASSIDISAYGGGVNSVVMVPGGYLAAAIEADVKQENGKIVFFNSSGNYVTQITVGALPDMVTVTEDGKKILVANEGEPNDEYTVDAPGSVSIIDISNGIEGLTDSDVTNLTFENAPSYIAGSLRKPGTPYAIDLEPEYIACNKASTLAAVICQESNVFVFVDLTNNSIVNYKGLGFKDHSLPGNGFDASNKDDAINIQNWNVKGVYQPDAIASYTVNSKTYFLSANEGDGRDYDGYSSEIRIKDLTIDENNYTSDDLSDDKLGRLKSFTPDVIGDSDNDGKTESIYSYGARSFSIWDSTGNLVWDSGDDFEQYIAANHSSFFNCDDGLADEKDGRSDDKGPEPEAITVGEIGNKYFAFIGLERQGGIMIYDITNPNQPVFENYIHTLQSDGTMIDIAPEGLLFISAEESHTGKNMLIVSNEVSGTTTFYEVNETIISVNETAASSFSFFPNPAQDVLTIKTNNGGKALVQNATTGQTVRTFTLNDTTETINIKTLEAGTYVLTIIDAKNDARQSTLFVKK
jgi:hypothetical protein